MRITVRMVGPTPTPTADEEGGVVHTYRIKSISGAVTLLGNTGEHRAGDLVSEEVAKGLALDYEITTEEYTG